MKSIASDKAHIEFLVYLFQKKAFDDETAVAIDECPIKGVNVKLEFKHDRIAKTMNKKRVFLTLLGKSIVLGEISLRRNRLKHQIS